MIELIATAESVEQAEALLAVGVDTLYIGEETFGYACRHHFRVKSSKTLLRWLIEQAKK